jgi:hypothetical protein
MSCSRIINDDNPRAPPPPSRARRRSSLPGMANARALPERWYQGAAA